MNDKTGTFDAMRKSSTSNFDTRGKRHRDPMNAQTGRVSQMVELGKNRPIVDLGAIEEEEFPGLGESFLKPGGNTPGATKKGEGSEKSETI